MPAAKEEMVEVVQATPRERDQKRIAKQSDPVLPDKEDIREVIQFQNREADCGYHLGQNAYRKGPLFGVNLHL